MKYKGNIIGFKPSQGSIYALGMEDKKCYLWYASVNGTYLAGKIDIQFIWNGEHFQISLFPQKKITTAVIFISMVIRVEDAFYTHMPIKTTLSQRRLDEIDDDNYECIIELNPIE
jgi:hypothetical protein